MGDASVQRCAKRQVTPRPPELSPGRRHPAATGGGGLEVGRSRGAGQTKAVRPEGRRRVCAVRPQEDTGGGGAGRRVRKDSARKTHPTAAAVPRGASGAGPAAPRRQLRGTAVIHSFRKLSPPGRSDPRPGGLSLAPRPAPGASGPRLTWFLGGAGVRAPEAHAAPAGLAALPTRTPAVPSRCGRARGHSGGRAGAGEHGRRGWRAGSLRPAGPRPGRPGRPWLRVRLLAMEGPPGARPPARPRTQPST